MINNLLALGQENVAENEDAIIDEILECNSDLMIQKDGVARRAQHPKHHGCARATFSVRTGIPDELKVGLFSEPKTYESLIRFSNGLQHDDRQQDAHGMAIKLLSVPGEKLEPDPEAVDSFDFVLVDHPVMFAQDLAEYRAANELIHDKLVIERSDTLWLFKKIAGAWETAEGAIEGGRKLLVRIKAFASQRPLSPLTAIYWSQTPYKLGEGRAVKYMAQPVGMVDQVEMLEGENMLAEALARGLAAGPQRFIFGVHVQEDPVAQPVENATVRWWSENDDPGGIAQMVPLADIDISGLEPNDRAERLAFSPWNVTEDHRPLGAINRVRRRVYRDLARRRR